MLGNPFGEKLCGPYCSCLAFVTNFEIEEYEMAIV